MSYTTILQIIMATCVATIPIGMALPWILRTLASKLSHRARPRFLVSYGVRRRSFPVKPTHEQQHNANPTS